MSRKISAHVDGGLSRGSRVRRPGSEDPHRRERKFSTLVIIQIVVVRTPQTLINPLLVKGNNFQKYYQFVFRMKTVILLLRSTMFGIGFGFVQELNFPGEDLEDSLYGTGDVLENNDAHKSNGKAMEKQCLAANLMNLWMLIKRNQ